MASNRTGKSGEEENQDETESTPPEKRTSNGAAGKEDGRSPLRKRRKVNHGQYEKGAVTWRHLLTVNLISMHILQEISKWPSLWL